MGWTAAQTLPCALVVRRGRSFLCLGLRTWGCETRVRVGEIRHGKHFAHGSARGKCPTNARLTIAIAVMTGYC